MQSEKWGIVQNMTYSIISRYRGILDTERQELKSVNPIVHKRYNQMSIQHELISYIDRGTGQKTLC